MAKKFKLAAFKEPIDGVPGVLLDLSGAAPATHTFDAVIDDTDDDDKIVEMVREAVAVCAEGQTIVLTEQPMIEASEEPSAEGGLGQGIKVTLRYYLLGAEEPAAATAEPYKGYEE